ncbi:MAG TPA: Shedu anti-phage system protein SduA domain-containing protein, partial [Pyrinomonadaceae bacterium]|nr:Shedu anti-phage system protein SduA domain-containing protein [Pyrinomonadaceae bacterium]
NADARRKFEQLFQAFKSLLDSNPEREEVLQQFLKENPSLLCPSYIKLFPKLALGNHITDFVFREATGDYLLVELERSTLRLFKNNGDLSADLNHALGQITDWKRYIEDNLPSIQRELGLTEISSNPKSLVVIGRSQTLSSDNKRKLATIENERPKTKILTYDDVLQNAKVVVENLLGPISAASGQSRVFYK